MLDKLRRKDERTETERLTDKGGREMEGKGREGEEEAGAAGVKRRLTTRRECDSTRLPLPPDVRERGIWCSSVILHFSSLSLSFFPEFDD